MPLLSAAGYFRQLSTLALVFLLAGTPGWAQDSPASVQRTALRDSSYGGNESGSLESCPGGCRKVRFNHWWVGLPSLPGQTSDLIVEASTQACAARLTVDKTATYTECRVIVEKLIKDTAGESVSPGSMLDVTREGGHVTLNGAIVSSWIAGQQLPQPRERYLFFLKYRHSTEDYLILTSYTITSQGLRAVDDPPHFHRHDGKLETALMPEVESSILDESTYLPPRHLRSPN